MTAWSWGAYSWLALVGIVPLVIVAYAFDGQRRRRVLERIGGATMIQRMTASHSPARRRWKAILTVTALTLLLLALARPQVPGRAKLTESRGLDLVVALDFSRSMLARDVYPSRLERAKAELAHLIDTLKGDRVGVVAFAGETLSYPLTVDYEAAKLFWRDLGPEDMPVGGTDLGRALSAATDLLVRTRKPDAKRRPAQVILLLTDGEDTEGRGLEAARAAKEAGIKIFTLGIGSTDRPLVQLYDEDGRASGMLSDQAGNPVRVGLDEASLRQIAALTGGDYIYLDPLRFGVERVQAAIRDLERTEEEARFEREPDDIGRFLLVPAFLLLVLESLVRERRRTRPRAVATESAAATAPRTRGLAAAWAPAHSAGRVAMILLLPFLGGFDLFQRRDPNIEEGNLLLQQGKAAEALQAYDRAAEALPDEPIVRFDRGAALFELGRLAEAQKEFQRATEGHDPQLKADAYYNMGNALYKQERFKEALDAYKHTLGLRPEDRRAKWNLELALKRLREQKQQQQPQPQQQKDPKQPRSQQPQPQPQPQDDSKQQQQPQSAQQPQDPKQPQQPQQPAAQQPSPSAQQRDQHPQPRPGEAAGDDQQKRDQAKREPPRDIDKQDAEAVLDALERSEPTVQKDLARRRAAGRRPAKDW